ncbi:unnamed protein product [Agarophyton chilense]
MTTYAMRCIRKAGGIDEYLIKTRDDEIKYDKAIAIKQEIMAARKAGLGVSNRADVKNVSEQSRSHQETQKKKNHDDSNDLHESGVPLRPTSTVMYRSTGLKELLQ